MNLFFNSVSDRGFLNFVSNTAVIFWIVLCLMVIILGLGFTVRNFRNPRSCLFL